MQYAVIIERSATGSGAFVPDLPGCVGVGETEEEARQLIREAIELHLDGLREDGEPIPPPSARVEHIDVQTAAQLLPRPAGLKKVPDSAIFFLLEQNDLRLAGPSRRGVRI